MFNEVGRNMIRFLFLVIFQGLILNQVHLGGDIHPFLYIMFILMLPFETPGWLVIILGFLTGVSMDAFSDTLGMHASACTFMAFLRPRILEALEPREGYESGMKPTLQVMGLSWYLSYAGFLTLIHHLWLFFIEVLRLSDFFHTLLRVLLSSGFTLLLIILAQYLLFQQRRRL